MKIAVPINDNKVSHDFNNSEEFYIYDIFNDKIKDREIIKNDVHGDENNAKFLDYNDVELIICGCMSDDTEKTFRTQGIDIINGVDGEADQMMENYLEGTLFVDPNLCKYKHSNNYNHNNVECSRH